MKKGYFLFALSAMISVFLMLAFISALTLSAPSITVLSPNGGQTYQSGNTMYTSWNGGYGTDNIVIDLLQVSGNSYLPVQGSSRVTIKNSGSYSLTIPSVPTASNYIIGVGILNTSSGVMSAYGYSGMFTITALPIVNSTACESPTCVGAYDTGKINERGCPIYACPTNQTLSCTDSDGGINYYVKGKVSASKGIGFDGVIYDHNPPAIFLDSCFKTINAPVEESDKVLENYCEENIRKFDIYTCTNGCREGACIQTSNATGCSMPICGGKYDTGKKDINGCIIYACPSKCEDYSYNQCPSWCEKKTSCLASTCKEGDVCPAAPCQIICATPGQKEIYLNQKFELKPQETAKVIDYKNMEIKYVAMLCTSSSCRENEPCPPTPNPCQLTLQVSISYSEGTGTTIGIGSTTDAAPPSLATTSTTSTGSSSSGSGGGSGTSTVGVGSGGVGTVFDLAPGDKKEVFGASISLLRLERDIAVLVVEEQIIIKPVCGNGICEAGEGEICVATTPAKSVFCGNEEKCNIPAPICKFSCPQDCSKYEAIPINLGEKFKLHISQTGDFKEENLKVTFKNMFASKCKEEVISSQASAVGIKEKVAEAERTLTGSVVSDLSTDKPVSVLRCVGSGPRALLSFEIARESNPTKKGVLELDLKEKKQIGDFTVAFLDYDYASRTGVFLIDKEKFICPEKCKCDTEGNTISCPDKKICEENEILCPDGECRDKCEIKTTEDCKYGCNYEGSCFPMGVRSKGLYCGNDLVMSSQKNSDQICENDFECSTNVCVSGKCVSNSLINKILDFFKRLFGAG